MKNPKIGGRKLKRIVAALLQAEDFEQGLAEIRQMPPRQAVNPLISFLCSTDAEVKWRAVTALGMIVSDLAGTDAESARIIMRRFIWQLNDESGGIGWGCPESMAEAMAHSELLASEFSCILISYIRPAGNYLEHEALQQGVLWGIGRLGHARPQYVRDAAELLFAYLDSRDPVLRGLAVWAAGSIAVQETIERFRQLSGDPANLMLYCGGQMVQTSVGRLAQEALKAIDRRRKNNHGLCELVQ